MWAVPCPEKQRYEIGLSETDTDMGVIINIHCYADINEVQSDCEV